MKRFRWLSTLVVLVLLAGLGLTQTFGEKNVIYLVRHADTPQNYENNPDPDLLPPGTSTPRRWRAWLRAPSEHSWRGIVQAHQRKPGISL